MESTCVSSRASMLAMMVSGGGHCLARGGEERVVEGAGSWDTAARGAVEDGAATTRRGVASDGGGGEGGAAGGGGGFEGADPPRASSAPRDRALRLTALLSACPITSTRAVQDTRRDVRIK